MASKKEATSDFTSCPVDREELGRGTWDLLHTVAAWFPDTPSSFEKEAARSLVSSLALLYPCTHCAADFQESIRDSPPQVESRTIFAIWLCRQHNLVNAKLDKPAFDCSIQNLDLRWRDGAPHCFEERERLGVDTSRESLADLKILDIRLHADVPPLSLPVLNLEPEKRCHSGKLTSKVERCKNGTKWTRPNRAQG
eukprot:CAMPEP_0185771650 /NCGR_PEP_ID=MMETSP1174-20130828/64434_1 /TAXON_ID=35687 /ORGANISM="Dictyocha speculum, Strain CCMP1381" /LENGTH=195 /DNA_ID=CAMNT_0028457561 /DNA_START=19 /DNA_END=603 /DNA_ORIENTATION=-